MSRHNDDIKRTVKGWFLISPLWISGLCLFYGKLVLETPIVG